MKKFNKKAILIITISILLVITAVTVIVLNNKKEVIDGNPETSINDNINEDNSTDETIEEEVEEVIDENEDLDSIVEDDTIATTTTNATTKKATTGATSKATTKATTTTTKASTTKCEPFRPQDIPSDVIWYKLWDPYNPGDAWAELDIRTELTKLNPNMKALTDYDIYNHSTWGGYVSVECANMPGYYYGAYWIIGLDSSPNYSKKCSETSSPDCLNGKAYVKPDGSIYWVWKIID